MCGLKNEPFPAKNQSKYYSILNQLTVDIQLIHLSSDRSHRLLALQKSVSDSIDDGGVFDVKLCTEVNRVQLSGLSISWVKNIFGVTAK